LKKMFIGGRWIAAQDGRTLFVIAPGDGKTYDDHGTFVKRFRR